MTGVELSYSKETFLNSNAPAVFVRGTASGFSGTSFS
jgi:hypothetical protein